MLSILTFFMSYVDVTTKVKFNGSIDINYLEGEQKKWVLQIFRRLVNLFHLFRRLVKTFDLFRWMVKHLRLFRRLVKSFYLFRRMVKPFYLFKGSSNLVKSLKG